MQMVMGQESLADVIGMIADEHPNGLRHRDFVRLAREHGWNEPDFSGKVHDTLRGMVETGSLVVEDDGYDREYFPAYVFTQ